MSDFDITIQWTIAGLVALVMLWRGQLTLFHPTAVYLAFHVVAFCIRPTLDQYFDFNFVWRYMQIIPQTADMEQALLLSSVGLIVFVVAFSMATFRAAPLEFGEKRELMDTDRRAFLYTAAVFGPLGVYSIFGADIKGERINGIFVMTGTSGYLNDLQNVLIPITILFVLVARWRWWSYLPFLAYVYYRATQGWGRWTIILSCFLLLLVWLWDHRRRFPPLIAVALAPLILMLFIKLSHDRMYFRSLVTGEESPNVEAVEASHDWRDKWDTLDFANFDFLTYILNAVPRKTKTFTYGTQYLQLFTEPIPRKLWPDKPVGAPVQFFDLNDYGNFVGLTFSLVGDGWMSGGWFGAVLTMTIAGSALGFAYRWFSNNQNIPHKACAFLIINAMIVQLFRDGGISIFKFLFFALIPLFVWDFLGRRFRLEQDVGGAREALKMARMERNDAALGIERPQLADAEEDDEQTDEFEDEEEFEGDEEAVEEDEELLDEEEFEESEEEEPEDDPDEPPPRGGRRTGPDDHA